MPAWNVRVAVRRDVHVRRRATSRSRPRCASWSPIALDAPPFGIVHRDRAPGSPSGSSWYQNHATADHERQREQAEHEEQRPDGWAVDATSRPTGEDADVGLVARVGRSVGRSASPSPSVTRARSPDAVTAGSPPAVQLRLEHHRRRDLVDDSLRRAALHPGLDQRCARRSRSSAARRTRPRRRGPARAHAAPRPRPSAAVAAGPVRPDSDSGRPTTMVAASSLAAASTIVRRSTRRIAASGARPEAATRSCPVGSESASPMRRAPRSTPERSDPSTVTLCTPARPASATLAGPRRARRRSPATFGPPPTTSSAPLADTAAERAWRSGRPARPPTRPRRRAPC